MRLCPSVRSRLSASAFRGLGGVLTLVLLASCGGGDVSDSASQAAADGSQRKQRASVAPPPIYVPPNAVPADAATRGMWSPVYDWPLIAVHTVLLPDGRLLSFGSQPNGAQGSIAGYDIWDPSGAPDAGHLNLPNGSGTDIFCSSTIALPPLSVASTPGIFIAGGDNWNGTTVTNSGNPNSNVLDVTTGVLNRQSDMKRARWYSTSTTLVNGETFIQGGNGGNDVPEIRGTDGSFRLLPGIDTPAFNSFYPRNFVAPDGRIFGFEADGQMYRIDPTGNGAITLYGRLDVMYSSWMSTAAMFRPGRILQIGGNSNGAVVIDITGAGAPVVRPTQSLSSLRAWANATILADGRVLATGGSQSADKLVGVNNSAEIWDPTTEQWMRGPSAVRPRLYHSNAILLPDASVLVSGGGATMIGGPAGSGPADNLNAEIYYPPYLFNAGQRAQRPVITAAPDWVEIGTVLPVDVANAATVSRVTLVKTGSVTHSNNMDQRFLDLPFTASGLRLSVQAPARAVDATPGYYMLFVFDQAGVPSVAKMVRMGVAATPNPATVPTLANPGAQANDAGATVNLPMVASDPNGDVLGYAATGLPPGLTLNASSGLISGTPLAAGTYNVVVAASDGVNVASASFTWTVTATNAVVLNPLPAVTAAQTGSAATFTASTQGGTNVVYKWNFGDGSAETAWSPTPTVAYTFANPGTYNVTLSVSDSSGAVQTRSFLQSVARPPTARPPSASTNIVVQPRASGNPLVWVVNQDADSISAFDTVTRVKQAEVAVGTAPRSIAIAPNGLLWVTNKRSDSISIVDPATSAVVRTVALPRGSQPFGVAMSPVDPWAFVVLEGSGRLLKFDSASYAPLGNLAVGSNPRQLSVTADGASVYVSRFVTPPLPGEATATVTPTPSRGAEVVMASAAGMSFMRTIVLQNSNAPDLENQGGGIPNYLGAATISPDGTQAWLPSKQDNIKRGTLRNGLALNFQNTVRAVSSRIDLATNQEDLAKRVDHDNASVASAAVYDRSGAFLFVALETSREVAVIDAYGGVPLLRFDVGRAPQGLAMSPDGKTLYVNNFMDRSIGVYDLNPLLTSGRMSVPWLATLGAVGTEKLPTAVLVGKQHFYDARDTRLARDRYMSCASCHNDGGSDGRVWDFTGQGEGLRNTTALRGRAGGHGNLHWTGNFDEVQDFEGQIRTLAGGTGLMSDAAYNTGTRNQPLGDRKAGLSADLDALAAYVASLDRFEPSPNRPSAAAASAAAEAGRAVFLAQACAGCHGGTAFTYSGVIERQNIGTIQPSSGQRLFAPLTALDVPTLRDVWRTAPYLHDGSAATLEQAVMAHNNVTISSGDLSALVAYLAEIGVDEAQAPGAAGTLAATASTSVALVNLTSVGSSDWAHWGNGGSPGLVRKVGGGAQISDVTPLQPGSPGRYGDDMRAVTWIDGAPVAASNNNTNGLFASGVGNGFTLTVPAGPTQRTVTVLLGGWNSSATFTARLTDGSAPVFTEITTAAAGIYSRRYTLTYSATSQSRLVLTWAQASGGGNVSISAVALSGAAAPVSNAPPTLAAPAAQSTTLGVAASLALAAADPDGDALSYSATGLPPGLALNAASGVISGTPTTAGNYTVAATVSDGRGGSATASFAWAVQAPPPVGAGSLTGAASTATTPVNLTTTGSADWAHWGNGGAPGLVRKASGGSQISAYTTLLAGGANPYNNDLRTVSWTDGAGTATSTGNANGVFVSGVGNGFSVTVPAGPTVRSVTVLVGGWNSTASFTARLADGSAANFTDMAPVATGLYSRRYTLTYSAPSSTTLTLTWSQVAGSGNVSMSGVALSAVAGNTPPTLATPAAQSTVQGTAVTLNLTASDADSDALTFTATGLPAGLGINAATGAITGTPTAAGSSAVAVTVSDGKGGTASANFNWTVTAANRPPTVTTPAAQNTTQGAAVTLGVAATDPDGNALAYSATGLPAGLGINAATGVISGTPTTAGISTATVTVSDGRGGNTAVSFAWTVAPANRPPVVSTPAAQTTAQGTAATLTIVATDPDGDTLTYGIDGLPGGLSLAPASGVITGSPSAAGTFNVTVAVIDGKGGSTAVGFVWTVTAANRPPVLTTPAAQTSVQGAAVTLSLVASDPDGDALTYAANGLPAGLAINAATGAITGTPTTAGTSPVSVSVSDGRGATASAGFTWTVTAGNRPPALTTPAAQTTVQGSAASLNLVASDADGDALSFAATGLPAGLVLNTATGAITGTPTTPGTSTVGIAANDGKGGTASASFTWTVTAANRAPVVTAPAAQATVQGTSITLGITASDPDGDALAYGATGLPAGLSLASGTGVISGTPTTVGTGTVTIAVVDGRGGSTAVSFNWTVTAANRAPVVTTPPAQSTVQGSAATLAVAASDADGDALSYAATGLPAGLAIDTATGAITGTPTTAGSSTVTVTVSDGRGGATAVSFGWVVQPAAAIGSLAGTVSTATTAVAMTTAGTTDWAHWGDTSATSIVRKASGGSLISTFTQVGAAPPARYTNDLRAMSWTDGAGTVTSSANRNGVYIYGVGNGFSVTVPASPTSRTVKVYVGGWNSAGTLQARLSDGSAPDYTATSVAAGGQYVNTYTVTYKSASRTAQLVLTWTQASGAGNVTLNGVALAP